MRIISCGDSEIEIKCRCGCTFAFDKSEILTDTTGRFTGYDGKPLRFIICPQCQNSVAL